MTTFLENPISHWLWFAGILLAGFLLKRPFSILLSKILYRLIHHANVPHSEMVPFLRKPLESLWFLLILYFAFDQLNIPISWNFAPRNVWGFRMVSIKAFELFLISLLAWLLIRIIKFISMVFLTRSQGSTTRLYDQIVPFFKDFGTVSIVILSVFVMLGRVFEVNVPALITGLGIGGLAIALAAKETLEDLFASFTIMLDSPFVINDKIKVGNMYGEVDKVGFRSVRLRMEDGSITTIPNRQVTSQALENLTQRMYRRCRFMLSLELDTPIQRVKTLVEDIQVMVENHEAIHKKDPGRTHFDGIADNSLQIYVRYHIATHDLGIFRKYQEEINYKIMELIQRNEVKLVGKSDVTVIQQGAITFVE